MAFVFAGCASAPAPTAEEKAMSEAQATQAAAEKIASTAKAGKKYTVVDDPTSAFEGMQPPAWIVQYIINGNIGVEKLPDYLKYHCFVVSYEGKDKDFAVTWVQNPANAAQQVSQMVSTTVGSDASTKISSDGGEVSRAMEQAQESMSNASFTGLTYTANFWQELKNKESGDTIFRAYALWVVDRKNLDNQIAANLQNIVDNNKALSAAERAIYADLIAGIRGAAGFQNSSLESDIEM
jgi:hypothetical protein